MSPYHVPGTTAGTDRIRELLERHVDFEEISDLCGRETPELVVGTVNINAGDFETFTNENVTPEAILASAAVPSLFEAVEIHGHYHWDGLFSQNPPIDDLMTVDIDRKPDELWVIQINPQEREGEPTTVEEIADRRNELSGNSSTKSYGSSSASTSGSTPATSPEATFRRPGSGVSRWGGRTTARRKSIGVRSS